MSAIKRNKEAIAVERKRLVVPAEEAAAGKLAKRYHNDSLGDVDVSQKGKDTIVDLGEFNSTVASRHNDDGTYSLFTVDPGTGGIELVVGDKDGKRTLTTRDAQHEYVFVEE
jgi:hypothetical protein